MWVRADTDVDPLLVPMIAETNHQGLQVESFVQGIDNQLDVLLVVTNSTTMEEYQSRLAAAVPSWFAAAAAKGVNLHVGITTTGLVPRDASCPGGAQGGEAGRLFPVDNSLPRLIDSAAPGAVQALRRNLQVGSCHGLVQGLETMRAALSAPLIESPDDPRTPLLNDGNRGLLRPAGRLAVVFLSDEDDHSGFDPISYLQLLRTLKGPGMAHRTQAHAVVPTDQGCLTAGPPGPRFAEVATQTGGQVLSVCSGSYAGLLDQLTTRAAGPQADFPLAAVPADLPTMGVRVDGVVVPAGNWRYDGPTQSLVFASHAVPAPGQRIVVEYRSTCPVRR
jgi:hypothetical protein